MALYFQRQNGERVIRAFAKKVADLPGGATISTSELTQSILKEGTPIGAKDSNGVYHVVKTAVMAKVATSSATTYTVAKGHNFKAGDYVTLGTGKKAYAISSIATNGTDATLDDITVGTTLGAAAAVGDVLIQASAEASGNTSTFKYKPVGLLGESYNVDNLGSLFANVVLIGVVKEENIDAVGDSVKGVLTGIQFV